MADLGENVGLYSYTLLPRSLSPLFSAESSTKFRSNVNSTQWLLQSSITIIVFLGNNLPPRRPFKVQCHKLSFSGSPMTSSPQSPLYKSTIDRAVPVVTTTIV